jgi:hypothetical protein
MLLDRVGIWSQHAMQAQSKASSKQSKRTTQASMFAMVGQEPARKTARIHDKLTKLSEPIMT